MWKSICLSVTHLRTNRLTDLENKAWFNLVWRLLKIRGQPSAIFFKIQHLKGWNRGWKKVFGSVVVRIDGKNGRWTISLCRPGPTQDTGTQDQNWYNVGEQKCVVTSSLICLAVRRKSLYSAKIWRRETERQLIKGI